MKFTVSIVVCLALAAVVHAGKCKCPIPIQTVASTSVIKFAVIGGEYIEHAARRCCIMIAWRGLHVRPRRESCTRIPYSYLSVDNKLASAVLIGTLTFTRQICPQYAKSTAEFSTLFLA